MSGDQPAHGLAHPPLAGRPTDGVLTPRAVTALAAGTPVRAVWRNELGGLTYRIGTDRYVKWVGHGIPELDLAAEAERLAWATPFTAVPCVLATGADDDGSWLLTRALPGRSAVEWGHDPRTAARAVGEGLRRLHEALPVTGCPFSWSAGERLARAVEHVEEHGPGTWFPEHRHLAVADALAVLRDPPPSERAVVCHGDACVPNTLMADDGSWAGHVDLGALGVADRWADLAVAAWSTEWNFGPGVTDEVYAAYGVTPDPDRIAYYRLLWDLS